MAKIEGLSTCEMARRLGESEESVASRLHQAMQNIRAFEDWD